MLPEAERAVLERMPTTRAGAGRAVLAVASGEGPVRPRTMIANEQER